MRTCHYVILGVEKNASDSDIKKAYRRKALEWHPDKNHHRVEEATKHFALIADAYEVLSDPQERAWYDSHRDAILRGDDTSDQAEGAAGTTSGELMRYYSSAAYKGFKDDKAGFFTVFRNIFEKLAQEEAEAVEANDRIEESTGDQTFYPSFGSSTTPCEGDSDSDVKRFYGAWLTFSTQKSFSWCDKFRLSEAPDRYVRRAMEKENKKLRDAARKEFNETVASLALFVRKRDPRFLAYQEQQKQRQEQAQANQKAKLEKEKELLRAKAEKFQEQAWTRVQEDDFDENGSGQDNSEEDEFDQEYECIICDKSFKSERAWKNHEQSKRHLKAVEEVRLEMLHDENMLLGQTEDGDASIVPEDHADRLDDEGEEDEFGAGDHAGSLLGSDVDELDVPDEVATPVLSKSKKKNKKKKVLTTGLDIDEAAIDDLDQDGLADLLGSVRMSSSSTPLGRSKAGNRHPKAQKDQGGDSDHEQDATPQSTAPGSRAESPDGTGRGGKAKKMSAKEKKKARAAQKSEFQCRVCSTDFDSKNLLFAHIEESGHATATVLEAKGSKQSAGTSMHDDLISSDEDSRRGRGKKGNRKRK